MSVTSISGISGSLSGGGAGCINRRLLLFLVFVVMFCLAFPFPAHSRLFKVRSFHDMPSPESQSPESVESPAPAEEPYFRDFSGSDNLSIYKRLERGKELPLGAFELENPALAQFVLLISFDNGGVLRHRSVKGGRGTSIRLENLELRYADPNGMRQERKLAKQIYKSNNWFYEVPFITPDQLQSSYKALLWGTLHEEDFRVARPGSYSENLNMKIDVIFSY